MMRIMKTVMVCALIAVAVSACSAGSTDTANESTQISAAAPSAPTNVIVTAGDAQATLTWDAVSGAVAYNVYWKNAAGVSLSDTVLAGSTSPYVHTGLTNGTTYYYAVTALNATGESALSSEVSAMPQAVAPGVPTNVSATAGYEQTTVTWDTSAGAVSYNLYWSNASGVTPSTGTKVIGVSSPYTHTGLTSNQAYYYVVTALDADAESAPSAQVSAIADYPQKRAFVTKASGQGNLSLWPLANGKNRLDAADEICNASAAAAGLSGTFKAWLSDENDDAYCRIHGGTGKKGACVGTTTTIGLAGPWIRMDGLPFAERIDQALAPTYKVLHPVLLDETGAPNVFGYYFSNTNEDGENATVSVTKPCNNWQSGNGADSFKGGYTVATGSQWTDGLGLNCDVAYRLLCLETGPGGNLPVSNGSGKKVFVTSATGTGNLSTWADAIAAGGKTGIAAGDAVCSARAAATGLIGTFKAFLSSTAVDAKDRLTSNGPWVRLDGVTVAASKADLLDDQLTAPINYTETGVYIPGDLYAVTGTYSGGTKVGDDCDDWTNAAGTGAVGDVSMTDATWTRYGIILCDLPAISYHLYCFED